MSGLLLDPPCSDISGLCLELLISYLYCGKLRLRPDNAHVLLAAAMQLGIQSAADLCKQFLANPLGGGGVNKEEGGSEDEGGGDDGEREKEEGDRKPPPPPQKNAASATKVCRQSPC